MFNKLAVVSLAALAAIAVAVPTDVSARTDGGNCNTGPIQCCQQTQNAQSSLLAGLVASLLHVNIGSLTGLIGTDCSPITVIGTGGSSCNATPVCCTNNVFNGLINAGCTPINVNL